MQNVTESEVDQAVSVIENPKSTHKEKTAAWGVAHRYVLQENRRVEAMERRSQFRLRVASA